MQILVWKGSSTQQNPPWFETGESMMEFTAVVEGRELRFRSVSLRSLCLELFEKRSSQNLKMIDHCVHR